MWNLRSELSILNKGLSCETLKSIEFYICVKEGKDKKAKVKEAKIKEINSVQIKEDDKEKKLSRIDKILTKDNLRFLKDITQSEGVSVFDYINRLVKEDQAKKSTEK